MYLRWEYKSDKFIFFFKFDENNNNVFDIFGIYIISYKYVWYFSLDECFIFFKMKIMIIMVLLV